MSQSHTGLYCGYNYVHGKGDKETTFMDVKYYV